jgi:hypothetical protein
MDILGKTFSFVRTLTALVVLGYVAISGYAFAAQGISWQEFSGAIGPIAGMLLGYWIKGETT